MCASTSIQMVSEYWQSTTSYIPKLSVQELDGRTLIPAKRGTLQAELVATARADGLIAYPLEPTFDALFSELSGHNPVIVLVNRSYSWYPLWHYAPVTGYDARKRTVLTHFSDQPDEAIPIETFAALWKRSGNWGVVLVPPGHLPASSSPKTFLRAAYELEKTGMREDAIRAYESAHLRWPEDTDVLFALANAQHHSNLLGDAEENYRKLLALRASHPLALNNLALLLCRTGRPDEAVKLLERVSTEDARIQEMIKTTREEIAAGCLHSEKQGDTSGDFF
jgi:tetratricopeptide (TPR) repeat protein